MPAADYHRDPDVWSPSRVRQYLRCPRSWWLATHVPRADAKVPVHWRRGTVAHLALEAAYNAAHRDGPRVPGESMIRFWPVADRALRIAWHALHMPDDAARRDELREQVRLVLTRLPVPHPDNILGPETQIRARIGTVNTAGTIDLPLRVAADWVHVRDWKTYSALPTPAELLDDVQVTFYAYLASLRWPWAERISVGIYSVPKSREVTVFVDAERRAEAAELVVTVAREAAADTVCKPVPSEWCGTCTHRDLCPLFNSDAVGVGPALDPQEIDQTRDALTVIDGF